MKNTSGKILGGGIGASIGFTVNSLDKKGKGPSIPEYIAKSIAVYALYSYASEREDQTLENCAIGYLAYETVRMTNIGRPKNKALHGIQNENNAPMVPQTSLRSNIAQPDFLQGVGSALKGLSSLMGAFKGNSDNSGD